MRVHGSRRPSNVGASNTNMVHFNKVSTNNVTKIWVSLGLTTADKAYKLDFIGNSTHWLLQCSFMSPHNLSSMALDDLTVG